MKKVFCLLQLIHQVPPSGVWCTRASQDQKRVLVGDKVSLGLRFCHQVSEIVNLVALEQAGSVPTHYISRQAKEIDNGLPCRSSCYNTYKKG